MKLIKFVIIGIIGTLAGAFAFPYIDRLVVKYLPNQKFSGNLFTDQWVTLSAVGAAVGLLLSFIEPQLRAFINKKSLFTLLGVICAIGGIVSGFDSDVIGAALLFTVPGSASATNTVQYCPANLVFTVTTPPTLLQVNIAGKGTVVNLDQAGIIAVNQNFRFGLPANVYIIPIGDGTLVQTNTLITLSNASVNPVDVLGNGIARMAMLQTHQTEVVLANSGVTFRDFTVLNIPSAANTDIITISYTNGFTQQYRADELSAISVTYQNPLQVSINNIAGNIKEVYYLPTANRNVYITSMVMAA